MLVPHLCFRGDCEEAIKLYEKAFDTKVDHILFNNELVPGNTGIAHAEMYIHGQRVMLNDRFGRTERDTNVAVQMIVIFKTEDELLKSYEIMKENSFTVDPLQKAFYSPLVVLFIDVFGVQWGFMVDDDI